MILYEKRKDAGGDAPAPQVVLKDGQTSAAAISRRGSVAPLPAS